jgi:hypothetical protein
LQTTGGNIYILRSLIGRSHVSAVRVARLWKLRRVVQVIEDIDIPSTPHIKAFRPQLREQSSTSKLVVSCSRLTGA